MVKVTYDDLNIFGLVMLGFLVGLFLVLLWGCGWLKKLYNIITKILRNKRGVR
jgi:hypothetical protein